MKTDQQYIGNLDNTCAYFIFVANRSASSDTTHECARVLRARATALTNVQAKLEVHTQNGWLLEGYRAGAGHRTA